MQRSSKTPEERRKDLIEMAEILFEKNGFMATAVSDIVRGLGVAQGTFYYYFKTKDEILGAILQKNWEEFYQQMEPNLKEKSFKPIERLKIIFAALFTPVEGKQGLEKYFHGHQYETELYASFHRKSDELRVKIFLPIIEKIIKEGIDEGTFHKIRNHQEIAEILFYGVSTYMHLHSPYFTDVDYLNGKMKALEELFEIVLGVKEGTFYFQSK